MESTVNDLLDRARLQIIRADEMVTRAMDSVEDTTDKVAHSVTSPIKHASGIMQGISTGLGTYFSQRRTRNTGPSDEMFI
jgi:cysteine synthase